MTKTFQVTFEINFQRPWTISNKWIYRQTPNMSGTLVGNKIVDDSDVVGASLVGGAPLKYTFLDLTGFNGQRQGKTRNI